jgi:hypothetical protein
MNTYFEVIFNRGQYNNRFDTMLEVNTAIAKVLNEDRAIAEIVTEKDSKTHRTITVYKPVFSVKLEWTEIPKYEGGITLIS